MKDFSHGQGVVLALVSAAGMTHSALLFFASTHQVGNRSLGPFGQTGLSIRLL